jgi:hypothetical protein
LTGRLVAGGRVAENQGTTCHMHTQELVLQHGLGIRTRTRNKQPIDEFLQGKALTKKFKKLSTFIMNKQDKNRFLNYSDYCKTNLGADVRKLVVPNDTRVSGIFFMFESLLRSYKCLTSYMSSNEHKHDFTEFDISPRDWQILAEFYSVMKVMNVLAMTSQKQSIDANCFSYYSVANAKFMIESAKKLQVIDFSNYYTTSMDFSKIPIINLEIHQLNQLSQDFMKRLVKEFDFYFKGPDGDQLLMMVFHPVMVWSGLS